MDLNKWAIVNGYYRAIWHKFSAQALSKVLDDNVESFHVARQEKCKGVKDVVATYVKNFFNTVDLASTKVFGFQMTPVNGCPEYDMIVTYTLRQTHSNRGDTFGSVTEYFKVNEDATKITSICMDSTFKRDTDVIDPTLRKEAPVVAVSIEEKTPLKAEEEKVRVDVKFNDTIKARQFCDKMERYNIEVEIEDPKYPYKITLIGNQQKITNLISGCDAITEFTLPK